MVEIIPLFTPFFVKTTAIMTAVIILIIIGAYLVSTSKKINRETVEKYIITIRISVISLILLEAYLTYIDQ